MGTLIINISQIKKLESRKTEKLTQGHPVCNLRTSIGFKPNFNPKVYPVNIMLLQLFKHLLHSYTSFLISFLIFCLSWPVNWWCLSNELVATELQWLWVNVDKRDTAIYWAVIKTKIIHTSHAYCQRHWPHSNHKFFFNVTGSFLLTVSASVSPKVLDNLRVMSLPSSLLSPHTKRIS